MHQAIENRGPDSGGIWNSSDLPIFLGHRRLSILDLSAAGHQPMLSRTGRYVIVFNGEIYNHLDIRSNLNKIANIHWNGHSDTETLLAAVEAYGLEKTLNECVGMFAFALWDVRKQELSLARDRLGEKPIYYGFQEDTLIFGSQLKSFRRHPNFSKKVNRDALALYFRHNAIASPYSIYEGIYKLFPGSFVTLNKDCLKRKSLPSPTFYWSLNSIISNALDKPFSGSRAAAVDQLDTLITKSVSQQMISDVPLGAFLSGGIDSSLIVSIMQSLSSRQISTFTIGFNEATLNEAKYASEIATYLGTKHSELYVSQSDALSFVQDLPFIYDEPFSDSSQIPTLLVSKLAKEQVTVSLSGDGGDELFCGYQRYLFANNTWRGLSVFPTPLRNCIAQLMLSLPPSVVNDLLKYFSRTLPSLRKRDLTNSFDKIAKLFSFSSPELFYRSLVSHIDEPESLVLHSREPLHPYSDINQFPNIKPFLHKIMALDTITYLPDDILTKVDRASMEFSLESRIPFLDHRLLEFSWSLPLSYKVHNNDQKWILKRVLENYIPLSLFDRPKMGFGVPLSNWLLGPLRELCDFLFDSSRISESGYLNPNLVDKFWKEHKAGKRNWQYILWDILVWELWLIDMIES